jgi:hypothetical protein
MGAAINWFMIVPPSPGAFNESAPVATAFEITSTNDSRTQAIVKRNGCRDGKRNGFEIHGSERDDGAMSLNFDHAPAIKRTPGTFAFLTCHCKITAADDAGFLQGVASAFDFLRVTGVELQLADGAIGLDKFNADDAAASIEDEALDDVGFGLGLEHGFS